MENDNILIVTRHCEYDKTQGLDGPLTPDGCLEARDIGVQLVKLGLVPKRVFHSDAARATQTATILSEIFSDAAHCPIQPVSSRWLGVRFSAQALQIPPDHGNPLMLVTHEANMRYTMMQLAYFTGVASHHFQHGETRVLGQNGTAHQLDATALRPSAVYPDSTGIKARLDIHPSPW